MTREELIGKIKEEIENLTHIAAQNAGLSNDKYEDGQIDAYGLILSFIESLEQSIDADKMIGLDEAAEEYTEENASSCDYIGAAKVEAAFKAGAKWMAEQGVSVDGEFGIRGVETESIVNELLNGGFKMGDKVIVQIRKK